MKFTYFTSCVQSTADLIHAMQDQAISVSLPTFRRHCDMTEVARNLGYSVGSERGLHLKDDWHVAFFKSRYDGNPCYYMKHSAIEYIWTKP